jgi:ADP-ribose pyrophosphatase YjhB (NUDIX family)
MTGTPPAQNSHCSWCGAAFDPGSAWPRTCASCGSTSFLNPLPVVIVLIPVDRGVLVVRRSIQPGFGLLALPGGYINFGETWREAAAREVFEETTLPLQPAEVNETCVESAPDGTLIIVALVNARHTKDLPAFVPNEECSERLVLDQPAPMAFPLHEQVIRDFFQNREFYRD